MPKRIPSRVKTIGLIGDNWNVLGARTIRINSKISQDGMNEWNGTPLARARAFDRKSLSLRRTRVFKWQ